MSDEQSAVQAIINWLQSEAGEYESLACSIDTSMGQINEAHLRAKIGMEAARLRMTAAVYRAVVVDIAEGRWKGHQAALIMTGAIRG